MKKEVTVSYTYVIEYDVEEHFEDLLGFLKKEPTHNRYGFGLAKKTSQKEGKLVTGSFKCKRVGEGNIEKIREKLDK